MKKIALVELQEHQEVLYGLIELLLLQPVEIFVFAPAYMQEQLKPECQENEHLHWTSKLPQHSVPQFIQQVKEQLDTVDLIVFTTLVHHFAFFAQQTFVPPTVLLIHKGNAFFAPWANLSIRSLKDGLRLLRRLWLREDFFRKKLLEKLNYISFTDPLIERYMEDLVPDSCQLLPALPFTFYTPTPHASNRPIRIVVPGTVSSLTRNYELLFLALQKADAQLNSTVELIFLGKASGVRAEPLFNAIRRLDFQNIKIQTFDEALTESSYQQQLQTADFILLPLRAQIRFGLIREYYGKTSISGGINDVLRFGKPALLPDFYPLDPTLKSLSQRFHDAETLASLLIEWVNERTYLAIADQAPSLLAPFAKETRSHALMEILIPTFTFIEK